MSLIENRQPKIENAPADRFSRLLGACEILARNETAALTRHDFAALVRAQGVKSSLLADLALQAGLIDAASQSTARDRLTRLLEHTRENARVLSEMMESARKQRRKMRAAARRVRDLRSAYGTGGKPPRQEFSRHG